MTAASVSSESTEQAPPALPVLHNPILDADQVEQLLRDIEACTELVEILPKYAAQGHVPDRAGVTLGEARSLLASRAVRGLQLRYRYEGADWWDTLMPAGDRCRVVRIRHDFGASDRGPAAGQNPACAD